MEKNHLLFGLQLLCSVIPDTICFISTMYKIMKNMNIFCLVIQKVSIYECLSNSSILLSSAVGKFEDLRGGGSSNRMSYKGTGFDYIFAQIWGGLFPPGLATPSTLFRRPCSTTQWQHFLDDRHTPKSFITKVELNKMKLNWVFHNSVFGKFLKIKS